MRSRLRWAWNYWGTPIALWVVATLFTVDALEIGGSLRSGLAVIWVLAALVNTRREYRRRAQ